jgi:flagellar FliL protein
MAKKEKKAAAPETEAKDGEAKPGKDKKKMILAVVGAVVLFIAGGKVNGGGGGPTKTVIKVVYTTTTVPLGPVVTLDAITLNLADGHLLKVGVAFQLEHQEAAAAAGGHGEAAATAETNDPTKGYARALDTVIEVLGSHTMEELAGEGRQTAKEELVKKLEESYHGEIEDVYFHQFVMQ